MANEKSYAWPLLIIGLSIAIAVAWKLAPLVYARIPAEAKASLRESFDRHFNSAKSSAAAAQPSMDDADDPRTDDDSADEDAPSISGIQSVRRTASDIDKMQKGLKSADKSGPTNGAARRATK